MGDKWSQIVTIMTILSFAKLFYPIDALNLNIIKAHGRSDLFLRADLIKIPFLFILLFIAIPYGLESVAWSLLGYSVISFVINAYYPGKLFGFGVKEQIKGMIKTICSSIVMMLVINTINIGDPVVSIVLKITTGMVIYISMSLLLKIEAFHTISFLLKRKKNEE